MGGLTAAFLRVVNLQLHGENDNDKEAVCIEDQSGKFVLEKQVVFTGQSWHNILIDECET